MEIEKKDFSEEIESTSKKQWAKPECELIGKDKVRGGDVSFLSEGATSAGLKGTS